MGSPSTGNARPYEGNGHYYAFTSKKINWSDSLDESEDQQLNGVKDTWQQSPQKERTILLLTKAIMAAKLPITHSLAARTTTVTVEKRNGSGTEATRQKMGASSGKGRRMDTAPTTCTATGTQGSQTTKKMKTMQKFFHPDIGMIPTPAMSEAISANGALMEPNIISMSAQAMAGKGNQTKHLNQPP